MTQPSPVPRPKIRPIEPLVSYQPEWSGWVRQFMTIFLIIAVIFGLVLLVPVLQILVTTFLLAFLMYVPIRFLATKTQLRFRGSVVICYLLLLLAIIIIVLIIIPNVVQLARRLPDGLEDLQSRAKIFLDSAPPNSVLLPIVNLDMEFVLAPLRQLLNPSIVPPPVDGAIAPVVADATTSIPELNYSQIVSTVTSLATGLIGTITGLLSTAFLAIFLSLLVLLDLPNYQISIFNTIPAPYHREVRILLDRIGNVWRGFFRVQVTIGIMIGVLTALQLAVMGAPEPIGIAVMVAIISLIPTIGGFFSLIPLAILPLIAGSTVFPEMSNITFALFVVGINLVWTQIIWNVIAPKIMGDAVALPLPVIIIGIGIGAALGGILGAFLIVPTAGTLRVFVLYIVAKINARDPFPGQITPAMLDLEEL